MVYVNLILVYIVIYFENNGNLRRKGNPLDSASVVPHRKKSGPRSGTASLLCSLFQPDIAQMLCFRL